MEYFTNECLGCFSITIANFWMQYSNKEFGRSDTWTPALHAILALEFMQIEEKTYLIFVFPIQSEDSSLS